MEGVDIISRTEIIEANKTMIAYILALSLIVIFITSVISRIVMIKNNSRNPYEILIVVAICMFVTFVVCCLASTVFAVSTGRYEYTARINNTVYLTEFFERYDNITHDGDIYIFTDKN